MVTNTTTDFCPCWILFCIEVRTSNELFQISYDCARKNGIADELFGKICLTVIRSIFFSICGREDMKEIGRT